MTTLIRQIATILRPVLLLPVLAALFGLSGCGGGGTGGTGQTATTVTTTLTIQPATVTISPNTPTTFTVTGGTAPYRMVSSNLTVIPVNGVVSQDGNFTVTANTVATDTNVTLTVTDASNRTVSATVTVKGPSQLTIIPATAILFSNIPTVVTVSGGTPPYHLVSSNPAVLPVSSATSTTGNFLLIANNVPPDTTVTITAVDANNQTVTGTYTVKSATMI